MKKKQTNLSTKNLSLFTHYRRGSPRRLALALALAGASARRSLSSLLLSRRSLSSLSLSLSLSLLSLSLTHTHTHRVPNYPYVWSSWVKKERFCRMFELLLHSKCTAVFKPKHPIQSMMCFGSKSLGPLDVWTNTSQKTQTPWRTSLTYLKIISQRGVKCVKVHSSV